MTDKTTMKTSSLTIRMTMRNRYDLEILARSQRRNLSNVIGYLVDEFVNNNDIPMDKLWDVDDMEKIKKLAKHAPQLLTFDEELKLKELGKA